MDLPCIYDHNHNILSMRAAALHAKIPKFTIHEMVKRAAEGQSVKASRTMLTTEE